MITVNGQQIELKATVSLQEWLEVQGLNSDLVAVEYNGNLLFKKDYPDTLLKEGDVLEVVRFVGGG